MRKRWIESGRDDKRQPSSASLPSTETIGFEIAEGLTLQAIKSLGDKIGALIDWQSYGDARQYAIFVSFEMDSAVGPNPLGADFREIRCHRELARIDRVEAAFRSDADLESTMQFACRDRECPFCPMPRSAPPFTLASGRLSGSSSRSEDTIAERARNVPLIIRERSGSGGYVAQSGGVTSVEISCKHSGYHVR